MVRRPAAGLGRRLLTVDPQQILRRLQAALELHRAGRLAEAAAIYDRIRAAHPDNFDAAHLGGTAALQLGRTAEAADRLGLARRLDPRSAVCAMRFGVALGALGRLEQAESELRAALALDPVLPEGWFHLGLVLERAGRARDALAALRRAVEVNPAYAEAHDRLGALLSATEGHAAAEAPLRRCVELDPGYAPGWCDLGICLTYLGRLGEALRCFDRSLACNPSLHHAYAGRGLALERCYRLSEAADAYGQAVAGDPGDHQTRSARLLTLHYLDGVSREALLREHALFGSALDSGDDDRRRAALPPARDPGKRLRIGFVSPNLRRHSVASFLRPLLDGLDPAQFEIHLYHDHPVTDEVSERLRARASAWRSIAGMPHAAVEGIFRADALDILIDLAGHTELNRLPVFARRVAPVQVSYLGYPDTTGVRAMDYRLVDALSDPEGEAYAYCTEKLVRFAPTAWCYEAPEDAPAPAPSAGGPVVFGCFNNFAKITDSTLHAWGRLAAAVPGSRFLLKGLGLDEPTLRAEALRRMAAAGLDPARVELLGRIRGQAGHLAAYGRMDVALDTFPYHGTTTTCEALWMGVPVVSLAGDRHASRVGESLLTAVGHPEWIARDWDGYVRAAADLAAEPERRAALRASLRDEMRRSPLMDRAGQSARFGEALRRMWNDWCSAPAGSERKVA